MKIIQWICKITAMISAIVLLGTIGSLDLGGISLARGIAQLSGALLVLGASLFWGRVAWVSEHRRRRRREIVRVPQQEQERPRLEIVCRTQQRAG